MAGHEAEQITAFSFPPAIAALCKVVPEADPPIGRGEPIYHCWAWPGTSSSRSSWGSELPVACGGSLRARPGGLPDGQCCTDSDAAEGGPPLAIWSGKLRDSISTRFSMSLTMAWLSMARLDFGLLSLPSADVLVLGSVAGRTGVVVAAVASLRGGPPMAGAC